MLLGKTTIFVGSIPIFMGKTIVFDDKSLKNRICLSELRIIIQLNIKVNVVTLNKHCKIMSHFGLILYWNMLSSGSKNNYTLWLFNIAMEHVP